MENNAIFEMRGLLKNAGQAFLVSAGKIQRNNSTGLSLYHSLNHW